MPDQVSYNTTYFKVISNRKIQISLTLAYECIKEIYRIVTFYNAFNRILCNSIDFFSEIKSAAFKKKSNFVISIVTSLLEQIN